MWRYLHPRPTGDIRGTVGVDEAPRPHHATVAVGQCTAHQHGSWPAQRNLTRLQQLDVRLGRDRGVSRAHRLFRGGLFGVAHRWTPPVLSVRRSFGAVSGDSGCCWSRVRNRVNTCVMTCSSCSSRSVVNSRCTVSMWCRSAVWYFSCPVAVSTAYWSRLSVG